MVSSGGSLAFTPAHSGRTNNNKGKFKGDRTGPQAVLALYAMLRGTEQIFWPPQGMPLSPRAFQGARVLC
jgi:hypothetical protein